MQRFSEYTYTILLLSTALLFVACQNKSGSPNLNDALHSDYVQYSNLSNDVVQPGDQVEIHYRITLPQKDTESNVLQQRTTEVIVGNQEVWPELDQALRGMQLQQEKQLTLDGANIFGERTPNLFVTLSRDFVPAGTQPHVGQILNFTDATGDTNPRRIVKVTADSLTIDMNHPLAGKQFTVDVTVIGIDNKY